MMDFKNILHYSTSFLSHEQLPLSQIKLICLLSFFIQLFSGCQRSNTLRREMNMNSSAYSVTSTGNSAEAPSRFISQSQSKDMQGRNEKCFTLMNQYIKVVIKIFGIWCGVSISGNVEGKMQNKCTLASLSRQDA